MEEKIAGLSKFWSEVKYNFIFVDRLLEVDWDSQYLAAIPKVMATTSTIDYYHVLEELCAKLRDGHTNVHLPRGVATQGIPINTQLIDGHVIVTNVYTHELADDGIRVGQEVLDVEGKPVLKRAAEDAIPYVAASTDLARERGVPETSIDSSKIT